MILRVLLLVTLSMIVFGCVDGDVVLLWFANLSALGLASHLIKIEIQETERWRLQVVLDDQGADQSPSPVG